MFVMAGGGTGGHVMPLLAVARELQKRGHEVRFIGTRTGMEARLVPEAGFPIEWIEIGGWKRVGPRQALTTAFHFPLSLLRCLNLLRRWRASAIFSLGGFAAAPVVAAAILLRRPVVSMEPNAQPGMVNKLFGRYVYRALLGMAEAARFFPPGKSELTGIPVREQFFQVHDKRPEPELTVLITGGSQGSRTLNNAFRDSWPLFQQSAIPVSFLHQAGRASAEQLATDFMATGLSGQVTPFIQDMAGAYERADLIVSRSGAGAVAEMAAAGRPAILVPFPFAADDHQRKNAEAVAAAGAARLVLDREMTGERLFAEVANLASDRPALQAMAAAARSLAKPGAAVRAADVLEEAAHLHGRRVDTGVESRKNITNNKNTAKCF